VSGVLFHRASEGMGLSVGAKGILKSFIDRGRMHMVTCMHSEVRSYWRMTYPVPRA
jgi:hypothetical protein